MNIADSLPADWKRVLAPELEKPYIKELEQFVTEERKNHTVFPPEGDVFNAFHHTPYDAVKVLLLGQDPYHGPGQAHGLSFSVQAGVRPPPSLVNMLKELKDDLGCRIPNHGSLMPWADQGVMLLNAILTVRQAQPGSHQKKGWEKFTDAVIKALNARERPLVFLLWGGYAKKKEKLIDGSRHRVMIGTHPSPLSAHNGFFGSRPFSKVNEALKEIGQEPVNWQIENLDR